MSILHKMGEKYCGSSSYFDYKYVLMVFCDHQDTEFESHEIELSMSQPIFPRETRNVSGGKHFIHSTRLKKMCGISSYLWS